MNERTDKLAALQIAIKFEKKHLIERKESETKKLKKLSKESPLYAYILGKISEIDNLIECCERWEK